MSVPQTWIEDVERLLEPRLGELSNEDRTLARQIASKLLRRADEAGPSPEERDEPATKGRLPTRHSFGAAAALRLRLLRKWVRQLRNSFFGSPSPPLGSDAEALRWVNEILAGDRRPGRWEDLDHIWRVEELVDELNELTGHRVNVYEPLVERIEIPYSQIAGDTLAVTPSSPFYSFAREIRLMAEGSRFSPGEILDHVLTGARPHLKGVSHWSGEVKSTSSLFRGCEIASPRASVHFDGPPTYDQLRKLYQPLNEAWELHDERDAAWTLLQDLVEKVREKKQPNWGESFWGEVAELWFEEVGEKIEYKNLMNRYRQKTGGALPGEPY